MVRRLRLLLFGPPTIERDGESIALPFERRNQLPSISRSSIRGSVVPILLRRVHAAITRAEQDRGTELIELVGAVDGILQVQVPLDALSERVAWSRPVRARRLPRGSTPSRSPPQAGTPLLALERLSTRALSTRALSTRPPGQDPQAMDPLQDAGSKPD